MQRVREADVDQVGPQLDEHLIKTSESTLARPEAALEQLGVELAEAGQHDIGGLAQGPQMNLANLAEPDEGRAHHDGASRGGASRACACSRPSRAAATGSPPSTCS